MTSNRSKKELEINAAVCSMIPATDGEERFWDTGAREVLRGVLAYCHERDLLSDAEFWHALNSSVVEVRDMCRATPVGQMGAIFIQDPDSKQALGVYENLMSHMSRMKRTSQSGAKE